MHNRYGDSELAVGRYSVQILLRQCGHLAIHGLSYVDRFYDKLCSSEWIAGMSWDCVDMRVEHLMFNLTYNKSAERDLSAYDKFRMANWISAVLCEFAWSGVRIEDLCKVVKPSEII